MDAGQSTYAPLTFLTTRKSTSVDLKPGDKFGIKITEPVALFQTTVASPHNQNIPIDFLKGTKHGTKLSPTSQSYGAEVTNSSTNGKSLSVAPFNFFSDRRSYIQKVLDKNKELEFQNHSGLGTARRYLREQDRRSAE